jgi:ATP-binding cassette subfamily F protein uup
VSTQILAFHTAPGERGQTTALADLFQWQAFHAEQEKRTAAAERAANGAASPAAGAPAATAKRKKLSYKDQRDWDTLEGRILEAETKLANIEAECTKPAVASNGPKLLELTTSMSETRALIDQLYARWAELEALQSE